jgi:hypothetical protein
VPHRVCQAISERAQAAGRRGVGCRSAQTPRGAGRELAWFPRPGAAGPAWSNARRSPRFWGRWWAAIVGQTGPTPLSRTVLRTYHGGAGFEPPRGMGGRA